MAKRGWFHREPPETLPPLWEDDDDRLNIYDAAEIWRDSGKDEDSMFGYTEDELNDALNS